MNKIDELIKEAHWQHVVFHDINDSPKNPEHGAYVFTLSELNVLLTEVKKRNE